MVQPSLLPVGGGLRSRLVRVLAVFVRCTRPADPGCVGMFARHQRSCWYPWLVVFCFIFPCRPCSARLRTRSSGLVSAISTFGSIPGPFGLRFAGGTGGNLDIWLSMLIQLTRCSVRSCIWSCQQNGDGKAHTGDDALLTLCKIGAAYPCRKVPVLSRGSAFTRDQRPIGVRCGRCFRVTSGARQTEVPSG